MEDMEREQAIKMEVLKIASFTIIAVAAIIGGAYMYGSHVQAQASIQSAEAISVIEAKTAELRDQAAELDRENLRLQREILKGQAMLMDKLQQEIEPILVKVKASDEPDRSPRR